jgi:hypothetical protein
VQGSRNGRHSITLQQKLEDFKEQFEFVATSQRSKTVIEIFHRATEELLMDLDSPSTQVKRLAAKMCHAAGRMRKLLADVPSITRDNVSSAEVCDIREVIAAASEAALAAKEYQ